MAKKPAIKKPRSLKFRHVVEKAPKLPQPGRIYGAVECGIDVGNNSVAFRWKIFSRKPRGVK